MKTTELLLELEACIAKHNQLKEAVEAVVKRSPFIATQTGIQVELTFDTIKLLQNALKE